MRRLVLTVRYRPCRCLLNRIPPQIPKYSRPNATVAAAVRARVVARSAVQRRQRQAHERASLALVLSHHRLNKKTRVQAGTGEFRNCRQRFGASEAQARGAGARSTTGGPFGPPLLKRWTLRPTSVFMQKADLSGDVFHNAAVGGGILCDTDRGVQDSFSEVRKPGSCTGESGSLGVVFAVAAHTCWRCSAVRVVA